MCVCVRVRFVRGLPFCFDQRGCDDQQDVGKWMVAQLAMSLMGLFFFEEKEEELGASTHKSVPKTI